MRKKINKKVLVEVFFSLVIGVMVLTLSKFATTKIKDIRTEVAACHNTGPYQCSEVGDPVKCSSSNANCTPVNVASCECVSAPYCDSDHDGTACACGCQATSTGGYCKSCCLYSKCGVLGCESDTQTGGVCNPPLEPTIPVVATSCDGTQYCSSDCVGGTGPESCYGDVSCYDSKGGRLCDGTSSYNVYLFGCCNMGIGTTVKNCSVCIPVANYCGAGQDGWYDDCGGTGCGYCPGVNPVATPIPTVAGGGGGGGTSCVCNDYPSTIAATCSNDAFLCPTSNPATYCYGTKACLAPTFTSLSILNSSLTALTADSSGRNNICESTIASSTNPRIVLFRVVATDLDGYGDIVTVEIRRNGIVTALDFVSGSGNDATFIKSIDYTGVNENQAYPVETRVTDSNGQSTGWVNSGRSFKVWDCQVAVSGSLYDSSGGSLACNTSFTNLVDTNVNFTSLQFNGVSSSVSVVPSSISSYGGTNIVWSENYAPYFNGGSSSYPNGTLNVGSGRITRVVDSETNTSSCPLINQYNIRVGDYVSAYSTAPAAKIDFAFIRNQEGWFKAVGADIKAKYSVDSGVPATALSAALTTSWANVTNGLVSFTSSSNINGNNNALYGTPNNWWIDRNTNDSVTYSYQNFYNSFFVNGGVGVTKATWGDVLADGGIYFIDGDLNINSNFTLNNGKYLMIIIKGRMTIDQGVSRIEGIYVADGGIEAMGESANQLEINGMLYSRGNIRLARSFVDKSLNNDSPAIVVNYQPSLIFNMPGSLMRVLSGWKEE